MSQHTHVPRSTRFWPDDRTRRTCATICEWPTIRSVQARGRLENHNRAHNGVFVTVVLTSGRRLKNQGLVVSSGESHWVRELITILEAARARYQPAAPSSRSTRTLPPQGNAASVGRFRISSGNNRRAGGVNNRPAPHSKGGLVEARRSPCTGPAVRPAFRPAP
jgi:hypothetical protein